MTIADPSLTFDITDPALLSTLSRTLGDANRLLSEDEVVYSSDQLTFVASRDNWLSSPPPQVWVDGVLQSPSTYIAPGDGTVIFSTPVNVASTVTLTYWFNFYDTTDLYDFVSIGLIAVESSIGAYGQLNDGVLPRILKDPILQFAHVRALQGLLTGNLDNYLWKVEGRTVDKRAIAVNFMNAIKIYTGNIETTLAWLRPQFLAEGMNVLLNVDMGQPPNKYSSFELGLAALDLGVDFGVD